LTSVKRGWFRMRIPAQAVSGDCHVTVIKMPSEPPDVSVAARWIAQDDSQPSPEAAASGQPGGHRLLVTVPQDLPRGWSLDAAACEGTVGDEQFVRCFHFAPELCQADVVAVRRLNPGVEVTLPMHGLLPQHGIVLKVRLRGPAGQVAWIWDDVPDLMTKSASPKIARRSELSGQRR
jgi:hypothetical protein